MYNYTVHQVTGKPNAFNTVDANDYVLVSQSKNYCPWAEVCGFSSSIYHDDGRHHVTLPTQKTPQQARAQALAYIERTGNA